MSAHPFSSHVYDNNSTNIHILFRDSDYPSNRSRLLIKQVLSKWSSLPRSSWQSLNSMPISRCFSTVRSNISPNQQCQWLSSQCLSKSALSSVTQCRSVALVSRPKSKIRYFIWIDVGSYKNAQPKSHFIGSARSIHCSM